MKVAFGTTIWMRDSISGRLDGLGVYTKEIFNALLKLNIELEPYSFVDGRVEGIDVCRSSLSFRSHVLSHYLLNLPIDDLKGCIKGCDILFTPDHHIAYSKNIPTVATIMDIIPLIYPEWISPSKLRTLKNHLFTSAIKRCDRVITVSEHSKKDLIKHLGISKDLIDVVPLGVDRRFFEIISDKERENILSKYGLRYKKFFLNIGTIQPRKNLSIIMEAHRRLPQKIREEYPLIVVGKYGWRAKRDIDELERLQEQGYGRWIKYIPDRDLRALLQSNRAMLYPSLYEGFGLPILEAFASKSIVIASNSSSIPEVAGDCAYLLDPYDIDGFKDSMLEVIESDLSNLIDKAYKRAKYFTWERSAKEHLESFKKLRG